MIEWWQVLVALLAAGGLVGSLTLALDGRRQERRRRERLLDREAWGEFQAGGWTGRRA